MASWIWFSDSESRAEVASSRIIIGASLSRALAIAILCFWPPDSKVPSSPTIVLYPFGRLSMKSWAEAFFAAEIISSSEADGLA